MLPKRLVVVAAFVVALQTTGCSPAYLVQATAGQMAIARAARPVSEVLADPATSAQLRHKLLLAEEALRFAHSALALPDNGSYLRYADIHRPFAVWNVFAAPEFSLTLHTWCFPIAGCVAYRGYFDERRARKFAGRWAAKGDDVFVGGAVAYSTLGFFRDPILSSVVRLPDAAVTGLIFHELAHQQLYVRGDTVFNESFATLVEQEGMIRWFSSRGDQAGLCDYLKGLEREREVNQLLGETREHLEAIYSSDAPPAATRVEKAAELDRLRRRLRRLREGWKQPPNFDVWSGEAFNNATLGALAAYDQLVGTLRVILDAEGGDLRAFYRRAARLGRLSAAERAAVLAEITSPTLRRPGAQCRDASG